MADARCYTAKLDAFGKGWELTSDFLLSSKSPRSSALLVTLHIAHPRMALMIPSIVAIMPKKTLIVLSIVRARELRALNALRIGAIVVSPVVTEGGESG